MTATKIVATIGPACESRDMIETLIRAGVSLFRFNVKHSTPDWHREKAHLVHEVSKSIGIPVGILFDLQGAEIRTGEVAGDELSLSTGEQIPLVSRSQEGKVILLPNEQVLSKLQKDAKISLDEGLKRTIDWYKQSDYFEKN
jgi:pyruvate kinase